MNSLKVTYLYKHKCSQCNLDYDSDYKEAFINKKCPNCKFKLRENADSK